MKRVIIFLFLPMLFACTITDKESEVVYLKDNETLLPIYFRGNRDSNKTIIWTHGGPGSSGMYYGDIPEVTELHKEFRIVYWDQLSSGGAMGNPSESDYNLDVFSNHLKGVIKIVRERTGSEKIFLLGHSWGGFLTSYFLGREESNQEGLDGVILLNPILNIDRSIKDSIQVVKDYIENKEYLNSSSNINWLQVDKWYEKNVDDSGYLYGKNVAIHYNYIEELGGMLIKRDRNDELKMSLTLKMGLLSPFHFYDYYNNQNMIRETLDIKGASLENDSEGIRLKSIEIPLLFIAGKMDKIAFDYMSIDWFDQVGSVEKEFKLYENSAHAAFLDEPERFRSDFKDFINKY